MELKPGSKIGKWTIISELPKKYGMRVYACKCECGHSSEVFRHNLLSGKSLGCFSCRKQSAYHGYSSRKDSRRKHLYSKWTSYKNRKLLCEEWKDINVFMEWCDDIGVEQNDVLMRIDTSLPYAPDNIEIKVVGGTNES